MKFFFITCFIILNTISAFSRTSNDSTLVEKTGWLMYYLGHVIWFEADLTDKVKDSYFFTGQNKYKNGCTIDYLDSAKSFKKIANCYSIRSLTNIDTVMLKEEYSYLEKICILPVKVRIKPLPASEPLDFTGLSFKKGKNEVTIEYWFLTNYSVWEVELLRKKDKRKMK